MVSKCICIESLIVKTSICFKMTKSLNSPSSQVKCSIRQIVSEIYRIGSLARRCNSQTIQKHPLKSYLGCSLIYYMYCIKHFIFSPLIKNNTPILLYCLVDYRPSGKVILHNIGVGSTIPSYTPFAMKLETFFRVANIPYEVKY